MSEITAIPVLGRVGSAEPAGNVTCTASPHLCLCVTEPSAGQTGNTFVSVQRLTGRQSQALAGAATAQQLCLEIKH